MDDAEAPDIEKLTETIARLPDPHRDLLQYLCKHLQKILSATDLNKMTTTNIATCFGPVTICTQFRSFPPLLFARALWQIALPPFRGVAAIHQCPLGGWRRSKEQKLTQFLSVFDVQNPFSGPHF